MEHRVVALEDEAALDSALSDADVLLNAAGPFSHTAPALLEACLRSGVHYLDITGEVDVLEVASQKDRKARERGIMILPGVGFDVVPSDCLAAHVSRRIPGAAWLALAIRGLVYASRGSYRTLVEQAGRPVRIRREGRLVPVVPGSLQRTFDFGDGKRESVAVSWGDVVSAWYTTGIPNIEVYFEATPVIGAMLNAARLFGRILRTRTAQALLKAQAELLPEGPTEQQRDSREAVIVAEAGDRAGRFAAARLSTPEAYSFTAQAATEVVERVLMGHFRVGFCTPAALFGPDFVTTLRGVRRMDLESGTEEEAMRGD
jgi:short subunit dehydrogenase-like uncharacterized protein